MRFMPSSELNKLYKHQSAIICLVSMHCSLRFLWRGRCPRPASLYMLYKKMHQKISSPRENNFQYIIVEESLKICCNVPRWGLFKQ
jgi:hypothetical protein